MHLPVQCVGFLLPATEAVLQRLQSLGRPAVEDAEVKQPCLQEEGQSEPVGGPGEEEDEREALGAGVVEQVCCRREVGVDHLRGQRSWWNNARY